ARRAAPRHGRQLLRGRVWLPGRAAGAEGEPCTFLHVSSALAYRGIPLQAAYCSSKAAARTYLESARVELQKHGYDVAVSLVLPGAINTPQSDRDRQKLGKQPQPVPPIYEPEPYAAAVLRCAEKPIRELPVSWGAQKLLWG